MIEIHDLKGTASIGNFANLKGATPMLDDLRVRGKLHETNHAVRVCAFKNGTLMRTYTVHFRDDKWRMTDIVMPPAA